MTRDIQSLSPRQREVAEAWIAETVRRFMPPLEFPEIRSGARALSGWYVEKRGRGDLSRRAVDGEGKRAAFASYFAPLHFFTVAELLLALCPAHHVPVRRVLDLGCGTGASGAAAVRWIADRGAGAPRALAVDRSGWALKECQRTYRSFGLSCRTKLGTLPRSFPPCGPGDLIVLGWAVNELAADERGDLLEKLATARDRGAAFLVFEPLAGRLSPWWEGWESRLVGDATGSHLFKFDLDRPEWIEKLDAATGLDHRTIGARVLGTGIES